jgi:hypothetical protein
MKTALTGRLVALTMLAGLLTAFAPIPAKDVRAEVPQPAGEACVSYSGERQDGPSDATAAEIELFGPALVPSTAGQPAAASLCPGRRCQPDATFFGCCNRFRVLGIDRLGACTILQRCER